MVIWLYKKTLCIGNTQPLVHLGLRNRSGRNLQCAIRMRWKQTKSNRGACQCCALSELTSSGSMNWQSALLDGAQSCVAAMFVRAANVSRMFLCVTALLNVRDADSRKENVIVAPWEFRDGEEEVIAALMEVSAPAGWCSWKDSRSRQRWSQALRRPGPSPPAQTPLYPASVQEDALNTIPWKSGLGLGAHDFLDASGLPRLPAVFASSFLPYGCLPCTCCLTWPAPLMAVLAESRGHLWATPGPWITSLLYFSGHQCSCHLSFCSLAV